MNDELNQVPTIENQYKSETYLEQVEHEIHEIRSHTLKKQRKRSKEGLKQKQQQQQLLVVVGAMLVTDAGEISGEIGIHGDDLGYVAVDLLNESDVLHQIVVDFGLVVVVHLLDQRAVAVEHRLHLPEILREGGPNRRIAFDLAAVFGGGRTGGLASCGGSRGEVCVVVHAPLSGGGGGGGGGGRLRFDS